ncbi:MAG: alpha/beta fold hydrolase [Actinomycetota bacterium]|nr:alpha/beta fold hydrolase [Actinomycetota bacterium]
MAERRIDVNGVSLYVVEEGEGFPVLLLHGFPDSSRLWREQIPHLTAAGFRVIAPDLRGFGRSDKPSEVSAYKMALIIADLEAVLDALGVERSHVVGHDWGAVAAWAFAGHKPLRTARLVAVSVGHPRSFLRAAHQQLFRSLYAAFFQIPVLSEAALEADNFKALRAVVPESDVDRYVEDLSRPGALTAGLNWYRANGSLRQFASTRNYPDLHVPVMGIWPAKDPWLGEKQMSGSESYCRAGWRYERIQAGHWVALTHPELLNRPLLEFLGSESAA